MSLPLRALYDARLAQGCAHCYSYSSSLELDHIDPSTKTRALSDFSYWNTRGRDAYLNELYKCQTLCVTCHRAKTSLESPDIKLGNHVAFHRREKKRAIYKQIKLDRIACVDCCLKINAQNWMGFEFDHFRRVDKVDNIAGLVYGASYKLHQELAKCDLLCKSCHKRRHSRGASHRRSKYF